MGGDSSFETIANLHNLFVLACAGAFATGAAIMTRSLLAGWFCFALALVLRYALRGFLFGADDGRTLIAFFPLAFVLLIVLLRPATWRIHRVVGILSALTIGAIIEMADLVRHSEGLLAFCGILLACLLVRAPLWRRTVTLLLIVLGSTLVMYAVPMSVRLFNDVKTGHHDGRLFSYLRPIHPSYHAGWHTLLISLGRYPNPEGLVLQQPQRCDESEGRVPRSPQDPGGGTRERTARLLSAVRPGSPSRLGPVARPRNCRGILFHPLRDQRGELPLGARIPSREGGSRPRADRGAARRTVRPRDVSPPPRGGLRDPPESQTRLPEAQLPRVVCVHGLACLHPGGGPGRRRVWASWTIAGCFSRCLPMSRSASVHGRWSRRTGRRWWWPTGACRSSPLPTSSPWLGAPYGETDGGSGS